MQAANGAPSRLHWKVEPLKVDVKPKVALVLFTDPLGPDVIVVSGATAAFTVQDWLAGVGSVLPAGSTARTLKVCVPFTRLE